MPREVTVGFASRISRRRDGVTDRAGLASIGLELYWAGHGPSWAGWEEVSGCGWDKAGLDGLGGHRCARLGRLAGLAGLVWAATG